MALNTHQTPSARSLAARYYNIAWRWHFYAGLYVIPFLMMLAITGLIMLYGSSIESPFGAKIYISGQGQQTSITSQAAAAVATVPGGTLGKYIAPRTPDRAPMFLIDVGKVQHVVSLDPYTNTVLADVIKDTTWFYWAHAIHNYFFMGTFGEHLIEIAAGLGIVLIITGLYLWWPRNGKSLAQVLVPNLATKNRALWKELHVSVGFYLSVILLFFLLSGMSWTAIWGGQFVQPWNTFPAQKWENVPLSDKTHATLNHGAMKEVGWAIEQTPLPKSGSDVRMSGMDMGSMTMSPSTTPTSARSIDLDRVVAFAHTLGFDRQFRVAVPKTDDGVYTISKDSMGGDSENPTADRTVHIDQYTGKILADLNFKDYALIGKAMAVGIALHQGNLGLWDIIANAAFCLLIVFLCISGIVMWWMRRPKGVARLMAPPQPAHNSLWKSAAMIMGLVGLAFPLAGATLAAVLLLDILVISRIPILARALS